MASVNFESFEVIVKKSYFFSIGIEIVYVFELYKPFAGVVLHIW